MTGTLGAAMSPVLGELLAGVWTLAASSLRSSGPQLTAVTNGKSEAGGTGEGGPSQRQALDRALVCDLLARRPGAVAAAWRHFVPFVRRTLARLAGPRADLDDLTQEVFERFFRRVDGLRSPDAVRPFLFGIALRVAKRDHRYRWLRRDLRAPGDADAPDTAALDPEARAAARRLHEHLQALKPQQRSLIVARYVEQMELRDVATAHDLSFNTMRRRLEQAWNLLERRLAGDELLAGYLTDAGGDRDR